jgi:hypothetical protein
MAGWGVARGNDGDERKAVDELAVIRQSVAATGADGDGGNLMVNEVWMNEEKVRVVDYL